MLPIVVSGSIFRWMLDGSFGIINFVLQGLGLLQGQRFWLTEPNYALLGTIIANIWVGIPFNMVLLLPGLQSLRRRSTRPRVSTAPPAGRAFATSRCRSCGRWR
jgi:ABC-type sugar transport system permease subunit